MVIEKNRQDLDYELVRVTGHIGAEVRGLDLADAGQAEMDELMRLAAEHNVVFLRGQFLEAEQVRRLGAMMGTPMWTPTLTPNTDWPDLWRIDNPGKANAGTEAWHTDSTYCSLPPSYTLLSAAVIPPHGGDTVFLNQYRSYEALSDTYKRLLTGLFARHATFGGQMGSLAANEVIAEIHPIVRLHPLTGRPALYVNPALGLTIEGMSAAESRSIIDFLHQHTVHVDRMYRHAWQAGDVLMWDNRCTLHAAVHDYGDETRTLYRYIVEGERPLPY
jgi:taurine dioxygenase